MTRLAIVLCSLPALAAAQTLLSDDFAADASYTGGGHDTGSGWWYQNTHGAGSAIVSDGSLTLDAGGTNDTIRTLLVSQASAFNPFASPLTISVSGLAIAGDPGANSNSFYVVLGRQQQDDGGPVDGGADEPWEYMPAGGWAYGSGGALGLEIQKRAGDAYYATVTDTGSGQSATTSLALTGTPTGFSWSLDGTGSAWSLTVEGATFTVGGTATSGGSVQNFSAASLASTSGTVARVAIGAMNSGGTATPTVATINAVAVANAAAVPEPAAFAAFAGLAALGLAAARRRRLRG